MLVRTDGRVHKSKSQRVANKAAFKSKKTSPPRPIVVGGHLHYEVETVLNTRGHGTRGGPVEYNVTWKGYPASANSWIQQLPAFFQTPSVDVQDDDSGSPSSSGSESSASDEGSYGYVANASRHVHHYAFDDDDDEDSDRCEGDTCDNDHYAFDDDDDEDSDGCEGGTCDNDVASMAPNAYANADSCVVKLLDDYKSEYDEYTFHTAYVFLHKQHRLARRMFTFRALREQAKILASYAKEDDEPTLQCQRWNLQMDGVIPQLFAGDLVEDSD
jgi:hypothetical protein